MYMPKRLHKLLLCSRTDPLLALKLIFHIIGGSSLSSQVLPKQEVSTATSKNYIFKKGDRIKFVGATPPSGLSSLQPALRKWRGEAESVRLRFAGINFLLARCQHLIFCDISCTKSC